MRPEISLDKGESHHCSKIDYNVSDPDYLDTKTQERLCGVSKTRNVKPLDFRQSNESVLEVLHRSEVSVVDNAVHPLVAATSEVRPLPGQLLAVEASVGILVWLLTKTYTFIYLDIYERSHCCPSLSSRFPRSAAKRMQARSRMPICAPRWRRVKFTSPLRRLYLV